MLKGLNYKGIVGELNLLPTLNRGQRFLHSEDWAAVPRLPLCQGPSRATWAVWPRAPEKVGPAQPSADVASHRYRRLALSFQLVSPRLKRAPF